jgi:glucose-6-phosphate 1-dehydrogenase
MQSKLVENGKRDFILFGASGDLARQKLYPALFDLFSHNLSMRYIGFARTEMTNGQFREMIETSVLDANKDANKDKLGQFLLSWEYVSGSYDEAGMMQLKQYSLHKERFFYLSIPSSFELVANIIEGLWQHKFITKESAIVLEKPFGFNYSSAEKINLFVQKYFSETQIYRIDHYLAKDLVQDMLALRFANPIFEPIWNGKYIEKIEIQIKETEGIRSRGQYYDKSGAMRDMIQNHALQLLTFSVMKRPKSLSAKSIHKEKISILEKIKLWDGKIEDAVFIGQYEGYRSEPYVDLGSLTETFASLKIFIDSPIWKNVPITIMSGKKLDKKTTDIIVYFKKSKESIWEKRGCNVESNVVSINVQPDNDIRLRLNSEYNAGDKCAYPTELRFGFSDNKSLLKEPYENALRDLFAHDQSIFINSKEILLSWKFIDEILANINPLRKKLLSIYDKK